MRFKIFVFSFLSLFLLLSPSILAVAPQIEITSYPTSITAGNEFDVSFSATSLEINSSYYMKTVGGDNFREVETLSGKTSSWETWNSSWTNMPEFTSNNEGSASASLKTKFKSSTSADTKEFKVRIRKVGSSTNYDSPIVNILVSAATPSPAPTSTPEPTQTTTSTLSPIPTSTATPKKTYAPKPTRTRTPKPTNGTGSPKVLGVQGESPDPLPESEENSEKPKINFFSIILIVVGFICVGFAGFAFLGQKGLNKRDDEKEIEESI